jgi:hypothetical protein
VEADTLDRMRARAVQGELALEAGAGEPGPKRLVAKSGGYSLQTARHLHAHDRGGLAFLVRYNLRPPLALARLAELPGGRILLRFKQPLADGTAGLVLEPLALLRRLASLVPAPGIHDTAYVACPEPAEGGSSPRTASIEGSSCGRAEPILTARGIPVWASRTSRSPPCPAMGSGSPKGRRSPESGTCAGPT